MASKALLLTLLLSLKTLLLLVLLLLLLLLSFAFSKPLQGKQEGSGYFQTLVSLLTKLWLLLLYHVFSAFLTSTRSNVAHGQHDNQIIITLCINNVT